ncbi:gluconolactonase [Pseudohongiella nitratireducens]|uniref:Gluconolactonase n=1 Tax=Pseudohongiella nitratireducens TaxID=1768907 RepID=A0A916VJP4_9GAMM|nr:SMP-30/gluconolactonase/LRE family protein [Pseudohongiella nitratireducens]MDF1622331.1 SMP-30/gluconolactonase/LRE family protein [Pseudohongiella nitratireducens]GFZ80350.1 gluconolactonase [Pseudohongiella nitratireducens]|tara:strand:- start:5083 stop:5973 length:891 start_codon:yes stop_codon:yes gene_type:complete
MKHDFDKWKKIRFTALLGLLLANPLQAQDLIEQGAEVELLSDAFTFTEGPIADANGNVYFSDIPANRIHVWTLEGELETFRENSNSANGLFFDQDWRLHAAEGGGRITRMNDMAEVTVLSDSYDGAPYNSPNDLWIDGEGGIYFSDPRYGNESNLPQPGYYVYYLAPGAEQAQLIITDLERPNGIIGTRDGDTLYVADHGGNRTYAYDINAPGELGDRRVIANQGSDGVTLDENGNLYLTEGRNINIYSSLGQPLQSLTFPMAPANMTFGGPNRDILFVTARSHLYALEMNVRGMY